MAALLAFAADLQLHPTDVEGARPVSDSCNDYQYPD